MPESNARRAARTAAASQKLEKNFAAHPRWPKVVGEGNSWFSLLGNGDRGDEIQPEAKAFGALAEKLRPVLRNLCPGNFRRRVGLG